MIALRRALCISAVACSLGVSIAQSPRAFLDAPHVVLPQDSAPFQRLFDFDGDGDLDAVGTRKRSDGVEYEATVWRNVGGRFEVAFQERQAMSRGEGRLAVATLDLEGDGDLDFAAAGGTSLMLYAQHGGSFGRTMLALPQRGSDLVAGDFDGDGRSDLAAFCRTSTTAGPGVLFLRLATGAVHQLGLPSSLSPYSRLEAVDLDGDPALELGIWYVVNPTLTCVAFEGGQLVSLPSLQAATTGSSSWCYWSSGDIDGDADVDIVAFELPLLGDSAAVHTFRRVGASALLAETAYPGGPAEMLLDADGDGDLDGVCCGGGGPGQPPTWPLLDFGSEFEIAWNDGAGNFAPAFSMPGKSSVRLAGVGDIDRDGALDLVAGACIYFGRGPLHHASMPLSSVPANEIFETTYLAGQLGDHDRDGDPDLLFDLRRRGVNDGTGAMVLIERDPALVPAGLFAGKPQFRGDFDGDGATDLVVPLFRDAATTQFSHMELFRNRGNGELIAAGAAAPSGARIGWLSYSYVTGLDSGMSADVDGDGRVDIIASADAGYEPQMRSQIWWNQGGTFVLGPILVNERIEVVADLNGDGLADALTRTNYPGVLRVRRGTGQRSAPFDAPVTLTSGVELDLLRDAIQLVDANGDARPDVIVRILLSNPLRQRFVLLCNSTPAGGAPSFTAVSSLFDDGYYGQTQATFADVDADGRADLIQFSAFDMAWALRIRRRIGGDGEVLAAQHFEAPVHQVAQGMYWADADADGDLDCIGRHVLRNLRLGANQAIPRRQYGAGTPGEAGQRPLLGIAGPLRGGATAELRLSGCTGPTTSLLLFSRASASLPDFLVPGLLGLVDPLQLFAVAPFPIAGTGHGHAGAAAALPVPIPPGSAGASICIQALVLDGAAAGGLAASNGLQVVIAR